MARDLPDWGALTAQATVHEVTDLGELAVRLGSIVSHDRRGDVVWLDEFECGLAKWDTTLDTTGGVIEIITSRSRNGECSCRLKNGTDNLRRAKIGRWLPVPTFSLMGVECSFELATLIETLEIQVYIRDGTSQTEFCIKWRETETDLQYLTTGGAWVTFASPVVLYHAARLFHTIKLVCDATTGKYVRVILNDQEYPLDGIIGKVSTPGPPAYWGVAILLIGREYHNDIVDVDDVILTQNEPPNA